MSSMIKHTNRCNNIKEEETTLYHPKHITMHISINHTPRTRKATMLLIHIPHQTNTTGTMTTVDPYCNLAIPTAQTLTSRRR